MLPVKEARVLMASRSSDTQKDRLETQKEEKKPVSLGRSEVFLVGIQAAGKEQLTS